MIGRNIGETSDGGKLYTKQAIDHEEKGLRLERAPKSLHEADFSAQEKQDFGPFSVHGGRAKRLYCCNLVANEPYRRRREDGEAAAE